MTDEKKDAFETEDFLPNELSKDDLSDDIDDVFDDISDDMNDFDNDMDYEFPQSKTHQSSINWFNIGIVGIVLVAFGGVAYVFLPPLFGSSESQPPVQLVQEQQQPQTQSDEVIRDLAQEAVTQNPLDEIINSGGLLNNPDSLVDPENQAAAAITADVVNTDELFKKIDSDQITFSDDEMENLFEAIPVSQSPSSPSTIDNPIETLPVPSDEAVTQLPTQSDNAEPDNIPDLTAIYEDFIPLIEQQPNTTSDTPVVTEDTTTVVSTNEDDKNTIAALNARIEELSKQIETLKNNPPVVAAPSVDMNTIQSQLSSMEQRIETLSKTQKTTAPAKKATVTQSKKYEPAYSPPPRERKPSVIWTLRGASPGQAVLAQQGQSSIRTVTVGEFVDGLGRIESVAIENGRWVVRGTSGRVTQ